MPRPEPILICALSGRALAEAARASGYAPIVLDAFADLDTREAAQAWARVPVDGAWRLRRGALLAAAKRLAAPPIPLVWGSGFERRPGVLDELAAGRELLGNDARIVRATKDPSRFAAAARTLDVRHPEVRALPPRDRSGWLCKRAGAAGGGHVHRAGSRVPKGHGWYWQRRVSGVPISALTVGDGSTARVLIVARQLTLENGTRRFRYSGTLAPAAITAAARAALERAAVGLAQHYGLRGLNSVDALASGDEITVLEVNPRPGGSLDAAGAALGVNLFAAHVGACRRRGPQAAPSAGRICGSRIVLAERSTRISEDFTWSPWAVDRSPPGTAIPKGGPICTVLAQATSSAGVLDLLTARAVAVQGGVERARLPFLPRPPTLPLQKMARP